MDPVDLPGESNLARVLRLVDWITHTSNARAKLVGMNMTETILEGNPYLRQARGFTDLIADLHEAREAVQGRESADFVWQQRAMAFPEPPRQFHLLEILPGPLDVVLPGPLEPAAASVSAHSRILVLHCSWLW